MSINWVMLNAAGNDFTPLANESKLWSSQPRTSFSLHSVNTYPGREPFSISVGAGRVHLTNRRVVYIPDRSTPQFSSFAAPILNLHDTHVTTPFFGPNSWLAVVQPVPGGGLNSQRSAIELRFTFKDGGAYEFHGNFSQTRERVQQAIEAARANGQGGAVNGVNMDSVHLEQLPAYESVAQNQHALPPQPPPQRAPQGAPSGPPAAGQSSQQPDEPPPGYDQVQREAVTERMEKMDFRH